MKKDNDITYCVLTMGKMMLYILSINIKISDEDYIKYMNYLYSDEKYLCVFTHTTLVDMIVMFGTLPKCAPIMNKHNELKYILYDESINDKLGGILLDRSKMGGNNGNYEAKNRSKKKWSGTIMYSTRQRHAT